MKKYIIPLFCVYLLLLSTACGTSEIPTVQSSVPINEGVTDSDTTSEPVSDTEAEESGKSQEKRISVTVNDQKLVIVLYDTPEAEALYNMLPLELNFEDYNNVEKIAYLPEELSAPNRSEAFDPDIGDLCLYAPWGNLSLFYRDFRLSKGLMSLGKVESGMEHIGELDGLSEVKRVK